VNVDTSACARSCMAAASYIVTYSREGVNTTSLTLVDTMLSGTTDQSQCVDAWFDLGGDIQLSCTEGIITANATGCRRSCITPQNYTITYGSDTTSLSLQSRMEWGETRQRQCSDAWYDLAGNVTVSCTEGVTTADTSDCSRSCMASSTFTFTYGSNTTSVSLTSTILSGATGQQQCSDAFSDLAGAMTLSCAEGLITTNSSACSRSCLASSAYLVTYGSDSAYVSLGVTVLSGQSKSLTCADAFSDLAGNMSFSCTEGKMTVDTSACSRSCMASSSATITYGSETTQLSLESTLESGQSVQRLCSAAFSDLAGSLTVTCQEGTLSANTTACSKSCMASANANATYGSQTKTISLTSTILSGQSTQRTCVSVFAGTAGNMDISCSEGSISVDTSACSTSCLANSSAVATYGAEAVDVSIVNTILSGASDTYECQTAFSGVTGNMLVSCSEGVTSIDTSGCSDAACPAGSSIIVTLSYPTTINVNVSYNSGQSFAVACGALDSSYEGTVTITCSKGALIASTSGCSYPEGTATTQVVVVSSTLSLQLPSVAGKTVSEVHEAFQTDEAKGAVQSSIADGLIVAKTTVHVKTITITAASRRLEELVGLTIGQLIRRLNSGTLSMNVDYEVHVDTSSTTDAASINMQSKMTNIGNSSSTESQTFATSFTTNLQQVSSGSDVLAALDTAVQASGLTIIGATAPSVTTRVVVVTTTTGVYTDYHEASADGGMGAGGVIAIVAGCVIFLFIIGVVVGYARLKMRPKQKIEELPLFNPVNDNLPEVVDDVPAQESPPYRVPQPPEPPASQNNLLDDWDDVAALDFDPNVLAQSITSVVQGDNRNYRHSLSNSAVPIMQADQEREASIDAAINAVRARALAKAPPQPPPGTLALTNGGPPFTPPPNGVVGPQTPMWPAPPQTPLPVNQNPMPPQTPPAVMQAWTPVDALGPQTPLIPNLSGTPTSITSISIASEEVHETTL